MAQFKWGSLAGKSAFCCYVGLIFVFLIIRCQVALLNYFEWGDESETIVAAKMLAHGSRLYSEIFNHHGPLVFLPGLILERFGSFTIPDHRMMIMAFQWLGLCSIFFSPLIKDSAVKVFLTGIVGTIIVVYLPDLYGQMYTYQVISAVLILIAISQFVLPSILLDGNVDPWRIFLGCFTLACLPFLAITYLPAAILMFVAALRCQNLKIYLLAFGLGVLLNLLLLSVIGSISGYIAYHFYLNSQILPKFNGGQSPMELIALAFNLATGDLRSALLFLIVGISATVTSRSEHSRIPWRTILLSLGVGSLLLRGVGFHGLPYIYACFAFLLPFFAKLRVHGRGPAVLSALFCGVVFLKLWDIDWAKIQKYQIAPTEFSAIVKLITDKGDKIIAYSFQNYQYIASDRLPASAHYFYLPMQGAYNQKPLFGFKSDACEEIAKYRPKIIMLDKWKVWDRYAWESYASCVDDIVGISYKKISNRPYYIRSDLLPDDFGLDLDGTGYALQPARSDLHQSGFPLYFSEGHVKDSRELNKLSVRLGTYGQKTSGRARLSLHRLDGEVVNVNFDLDHIKDNEYFDLDVPSGVYVAGEIHFESSAEKGISSSYKKVTPFDLTDDNWVGGISRGSAGFFVRKDQDYNGLFVEGGEVSFANGETRRIVKVQESDTYINVYVDGDVLDSSSVGYPAPISVLVPSATRVTAWEVSKMGGRSTCIVYRYTDHKVRFTPGCPVG